MKYRVERYFSNLTRECVGWSYQNFADLLHGLIYEMRDKIGSPLTGDQYHNLRFVMNLPFYDEFSIACQMTRLDSSAYRGVKIITDPTLRISDSQSTYGIVRLEYEEEPEMTYRANDVKAAYEFWTNQSKINNALGFSLTVPHIDHVKFNGPATIVFWKDGTKTVVKHDGKGRKDKRLAVLYAFMRKIYGEGKPYHNILNEIEEAIK